MAEQYGSVKSERAAANHSPCPFYILISSSGRNVRRRPLALRSSRRRDDGWYVHIIIIAYFREARGLGGGKYGPIRSHSQFLNGGVRGKSFWSVSYFAIIFQTYCRRMVWIFLFYVFNLIELVRLHSIILSLDYLKVTAQWIPRMLTEEKNNLSFTLLLQHLMSYQRQCNLCISNHGPWLVLVLSPRTIIQTVQSLFDLMNLELWQHLL